MGKPGDGIIYLSDIGEHVKLDKRGRPYRVGPDGRKEVRGSPRPKSSYSPEEWRALSAKREMSSFVVENSKKKLRSSRRSSWRRRRTRRPRPKSPRRKKYDSSSSKDPAKDESRKKKKKDNKKSKESSGKDGGKDAAVNVGTLRGEWERISTPHDPMTRPIHNRGRNPWERSPTPHGASDLDDIKKRDATSPSAPSGNEHKRPKWWWWSRVLEWVGRCSEHEVGIGPRAHWEEFAMTSIQGKSQHLLKLHQRLLPQKTPTASPRSTTSWVQFLVCLLFIKTLSIVRSSVKLMWGLEVVQCDGLTSCWSLRDDGRPGRQGFYEEWAVGTA